MELIIKTVGIPYCPLELRDKQIIYDVLLNNDTEENTFEFCSIEGCDTKVNILSAVVSSRFTDWN